MLPEHLRIKEYDQAIKLLDDVRAEVEAGNIMSIAIVCETTGGEMFGGCTASQNKFALAGYMIAWAMDRMDFPNRSMFRTPLEEKNDGSKP